MDELDDELEELAYETIGAAIEVHKELGAGFLESVYENAMAVELQRCQIPFERQVSIHVDYKGENVGEGRIDLLIGDRLIVELKTVSGFAPIHKAQLMSYLHATEKPLGLLLNFKAAKLKDGGIERIIRA